MVGESGFQCLVAAVHVKQIALGVVCGFESLSNSHEDVQCGQECWNLQVLVLALEPGNVQLALEY